MALDATGTPTSPDSIPKYNTAVDPPSGKGFNAAMDQIQTIITALRAASIQAPSGIASGEVPVWNGSAWVRSSVTRVGVGSLGSGTPSTDTYLRGDGAWARTPLGIVYKKNTAKTVVNSTATTDLLNAEVTVAANALSATGIFRLKACGSYVQNSGASQNSIRFQATLGGTIIADTNVVVGTPSGTSATAHPWEVDLIVSARNATNSQFVQLVADYLTIGTGSGASTFGTGSGLHELRAPIGGYAFGHAQGHNTTTKDMTAAQALALNVILPVANASVSITLESALVEIF